MSRSAIVALIVCAVFSFPGSSGAGAPASTLERIVQTRTIRLGYAPDAAPFSYLASDGTIIGYSVDICRRVVDLLQHKLGLAKLEIRYVPRTPGDRVLLLKDGSIDIECVASTNNAERRKSVAFSYTHFVTSTQFASLRASNLHRVADLRGRAVATTFGTTIIGQLNAINRERDLNLVVVPTQTHEAAFELMASGRVFAFVMDGILLATMVAHSDEPQAYEVSHEALGPPEPYGFMIRHDDLEFKNAVNAALHEIYTGGEIQSIYAKWFTAPIPPHGINLRWPMSDALKAAFSNPAKLSY